MQDREAASVKDAHVMQRARENSASFTCPSLVQRYDPEFWCDLFWEEFMGVDAAAAADGTDETVETGDDMLFFVRASSGASARKEATDPYFVRRRGTPMPERSDKGIHWEQTYYLNVIINRLAYTLVVTVRQRRPQGVKGKHLVVNKVVKKVWSSPTHVRVDTAKAEAQQPAYPRIFFTIHDYDNTFEDIVITQGNQFVGVELIAQGYVLGTKSKKHIFKGALGYEAILKGYHAKLSWRSGAGEKFLQLKGPGGKGEAQMAVSALEVSSPQVERHAAAMSSVGAAAEEGGGGGGSGGGSGDEDGHGSRTEAVGASSPSSGGLLGRTGAAVKGAFGWLSGRTKKAKANEQPALNCLLTYINVPWNSIITDLAWTHGKESSASGSASPSTQ